MQRSVPAWSGSFAICARDTANEIAEIARVQIELPGRPRSAVVGSRHSIEGMRLELVSQHEHFRRRLDSQANLVARDAHHGHDNRIPEPDTFAFAAPRRDRRRLPRLRRALATPARHAADRADGVRRRRVRARPRGAGLDPSHVGRGGGAGASPRRRWSWCCSPTPRASTYGCCDGSTRCRPACSASVFR